MTISFVPALGEIVRIPVQPHTGSVRLRFTAVLFFGEYRQYERDGAKLQVWCNIPAPGQASGTWWAWDFQEGQLPDDESRRSSDDELDFDQVVLSLVVNAPLAPEMQSYSFTYRILYPTGEVKWLGKADLNGAFILRRRRNRDPRDHSRQLIEFDSGTQVNEPPLLPQQEILDKSHLLQDNEIDSLDSEADIVPPHIDENTVRRDPPVFMQSQTPRLTKPLRPRRSDIRLGKEAEIQPFSFDQWDDLVLPTIEEEVHNTAVVPGNTLISRFDSSHDSEESTASSESSTSSIIPFYRRTLSMPQLSTPAPLVRVRQPLVRRRPNDYIPPVPPLPSPPPVPLILSSPPPASAPPAIPLPTQPAIADPGTVVPPKEQPLMVWGWLLDADIYTPNTHPVCTSLPDRYERFINAMKSAQVIEVARFKGFVSDNASQFCFHFASNRNEKEKRKKLSREQVKRLMEAAGTDRAPRWIEIPGSASAAYLEVKRNERGHDEGLRERD